MAVAALVVKVAAELLIGESGTAAALVLLSWLLLVVDVKLLPRTVSLIQPFLPGIGWLDLGVALLAYAGLALFIFYADAAADSRAVILLWLCMMAVSAVLGVLGLFRWQRWRGTKRET